LTLESNVLLESASVTFMELMLAGEKYAIVQFVQI